MNTKHLPFCLALLAATGTVGVAVAGPDEQSSVSAGDCNRFVIHDGTLAISRPDGSWDFQVDTAYHQLIVISFTKLPCPDYGELGRGRRHNLNRSSRVESM